MNSKTPGRWVDFPAVLSTSFFVLALLQVSHHVMWRDEIRTWQVCRQASGLISLWQLMRFEGVPVLWYWIVWVLTRISGNPFLMQFVHVMIATAVVYVVARWAPFSRINKVLFALGYFPFFEYAAITRNYALVFLLIMIACALIAQERLRWIALTAVLFLLTQVSIWGAGLGGLLLASAAAKAWLGPRQQWPTWPALVGAGVAVGLGILFCYIEVLPGPGPSFTDSWRGYPASARFFLSIGSIYRAWIPLPRVDAHFWNTNVLDSAPAVQAMLGGSLLLFALASMVRRPVALGWMLLGIGALVGFTLLKFRGYARHDGMLFIVLIAAMWLAQRTPPWTIPHPWLAQMAQRLERMRGLHFAMLLAVNVIAGLMAAGMGWTKPFSATRAIADYIRNQFDDRVALAAYTDYCASPISQWLDRPIYSIEMHQDVRYNSQDDSTRDPVSMLMEGDAYLIRNVYHLIQERHSDVLLMLNSGVYLGSVEYRLQFGPEQPPLIIKVLEYREFNEGVVKDESQMLYLLRAIQ